MILHFFRPIKFISGRAFVLDEQDILVISVFQPQVSVYQSLHPCLLFLSNQYGGHNKGTSYMHARVLLPM